ncbi:MAG: PTS sugar transporter subunit IIA [Kiritimatiellae bacterium]|nr:PTS sugar transporter subunit IIA [Kiritimatiellia bacterium]
MKNQLNILSQLQELVLTRDEHRRLGDGSQIDALDSSIDTLIEQLTPPVQNVYQRLYKKDHVVIASVANNCCSMCGMRLPISQMQQVRLEKTIQVCASCGRILCNEDEAAPKNVAEKAGRGEPRKTGISRFSAEGLMICDLKSTNTKDAIKELADAMVANNFVSNADSIVKSVLEREAILTTAIGNGVAFPHVRGVEGGGLTLALGVSKKGFVYDADGNVVNLVFLSAIPLAVSAFYLRLISGISEALGKADVRKSLIDAESNAELWKSLVKATRNTIH